ncbi:MAG: heavy metal translocating P-type ATPase [Paracoccaceae bacterium]
MEHLEQDRIVTVVEAIDVTGLSCAACAGRVERALAAVKGVEAANVNFVTARATLRCDGPVPAENLKEALEDAGYPARQEQVTFKIEGMTCASCVGRLEQEVLKVRGVEQAEANLALRTLRIRYISGLTEQDELQKAIQGAGYTSVLSDGEQVDRMSHGGVDPEVQDLKFRVLIAAVLTLPVFVIEMGGHIFPPLHHWVAQNVGQSNSQMMQMFLTAMVLAGPGRVFFTKGFPALLRGAPDMNALVALGTSAGFIYSALATLMPGLFPSGSVNVYFESAAVIVVLVLLGRLLESRARGRAGAAISKLIDLTPKQSMRVKDGGIQEVSVSDLRADDILRIRPGERIAADGEVISGTSFVDESMISGEPAPVAKEGGASLIAGTINGAGVLEMRATHVGPDTVLSGIVKMVEDAQGAKLPIQATVDRVTLWFVPAVIGVAALTVAIWMVFGPSPALPYALVAGVSVLIIACPCAMGLATPTSIMVGTGRAAEEGIIFRRGDALQRLDDVKLVVFDKTGTLTEGKPSLTSVALASGVARGHAIRLAASVEVHSEHPIAKAIVAASAGQILEATDIEVYAGFGLKAVVDGQTVYLGNKRLMERSGVDLSGLADRATEFARNGETPGWIACDDRVVAVFGISDPLKSGAAAAVAELKSSGVQVAMVTGDTMETAEVIAAKAGISEIHADCLPADKVAALENLKSEYGPIAFVGDGINDAPALAFSDVGLSIGGGTDIAMEAADVVLISEDPQQVAVARIVSQRTMRNIRENLVWAFGYNILLIPVAAGLLYPFGGPLLSPALAAGAMAISSVLVVSNALRLKRLRFVRPSADNPKQPQMGPAERLGAQ